MISLKYRFAAALLLLLSVHAVFASGNAQTGRLTEIKAAGLKGPTSIGMLYMFEYSGEPGEKVHFTFSVAEDPQIMISRILSGEIDIAAVPVNLAAILYNKGVSIKIAAITGNGTLHVATKDQSVRTIHDLKGKRIFVPGQGSTPEFIVRYVLEGNDIIPGRDCELDFSYNQLEIGPQLVSGAISVCVLPEPFISILRTKDDSLSMPIDIQKEYSLLSGNTVDYPTTALVVKTSLYETDPEIVHEFLELYRYSILWVLDNEEKAGELSAKYLDMPAAVVRNAIPRLGLHFSRVHERYEELVSFYALLHSYAPQSIGGQIPDEDFFPEK